MIFIGLSKVFSTVRDGQYEAIGAFWDAMRVLFPDRTLSGVGYGWENDTLCYLIGTEDGLPAGTETIGQQFPDAEYTVLHLPDDGWKRYTATADTLDVLYEEIYRDGPLTYEIERFDADGRAEIRTLR